MTELGSLMYQRVEKPAQIVRERLSLNENCTAISTGTIAQSMYTQVMSARKRGRPHGFANQPRMRRRVEGLRAVAGLRVVVVMPAAPSSPGRP